MRSSMFGIVAGLATGPAISPGGHGYERFQSGYRWIYDAIVSGGEVLRDAPNPRRHCLAIHFSVNSTRSTCEPLERLSDSKNRYTRCIAREFTEKSIWHDCARRSGVLSRNTTNKGMTPTYKVLAIGSSRLHAKPSWTNSATDDTGMET